MIVVFQRRAPGLLSKLIRWWTRSEFSHCEVLFGRIMVSAVEGVGVRSLVVTEDLSAAQWEVVTPPKHDDRDAYLWAISEQGCKYDWLGILFCQIFKFGRQHKDRWFCSEFCTAALQHAGLFTQVRPYRYSPGGLYYLMTGVRK